MIFISFETMRRIIASIIAFVTLTSAAYAEDSVKGTDAKTFTANGVEFRMIAIPTGTYIAGAQNKWKDSVNYDAEAKNDEHPTHKTTITKMYMLETEVTQQLWTAVTGRDSKDEGWNKKSGKGETFPAYYVSYNEIKNIFLKKLNETMHATNQLPDSINFRLPTEAEWEYAARGGDNSTRYAGDTDINNVAWYWDNSDGIAHAVKQKKPNAYGLYDMNGNMWEWTSDIYYKYFSNAVTNPVVDGFGEERVLKGGSWMSNKDMNRITTRYRSAQDFEYVDYGFRIVLKEYAQ